MSVEASEMVSIPRGELDALKAELRRLRREAGRGIARAEIQADPGVGDDAPAFTRRPLLLTGGTRPAEQSGTKEQVTGSKGPIRGSAPSRIRTYAHGSGGRCSIP